MSQGALAAALAAGGGAARRAHAAAAALPMLLPGAALLAVAAWTGRLAGGGTPLAVLAAWVALLGGLALGVAGAWRATRAWRAPGVAARLEALGAERRGALTTLLDPAAAGTSDALHAAAAAAARARVDDGARTALAPDTQRAWRRASRTAVGIAGALVALVAARPLDSTAAMLWQPWRAWTALTGPVRLTAAASVARGEAATLEVAAWGQREAALYTRAPGEGWVRHVVALDGEGRGQFATPPLAADLVAYAEAGGRRSAEVRVAIRLPAFIGAFRVRATYPDYLAREGEDLPLAGDTLVVPAGTRLAVSGEASGALAGATLEGPRRVPLAVDGAAFAGTLVAAPGTWQLAASFADGATVDVPPPAFTLQVLADSLPRVEIPVPGRDTVAPPSGLAALVVSARDDHGLRAVALELRGPDGATVVRPLPLADGTADQALLPTELDLTALGLRPGDTLAYRAVARDRAPGDRAARSPTYRIRLATEAEQRAARQEATEAAASGLDSLAARARAAQRSTEDLARARTRSGDARDAEGGGDPLAAEAARAAERAAEAQEALAADAARLEEAVSDLEAAAASRADSALAADLAEIRDLLAEAMTPELEAAMEAVREAARALDPTRTRTALQDLAQQQARMRDALERAKSLFERAAAETELAALAEEAAELAARQEAARDTLATDPEAGAAAEERLAAEAERLAEALERSAERVPSDAAEEGVRAAAQEARQAGERMQQAAQSARQGEQQQARQQAQAAGESLQSLERQLRTERREMQEAMRAEVSEELDRLLVETSRLLDRQLVLADAYRRGAVTGEVRTEQALVEEGAARLFQQVLATAGKNALVSPRIATAMMSARGGMRAAVEAIATATPNLGLAADQAGGAVDALSVAAHALLRSKQDVDGSSSGSGMEEAMQQMQQAAGRQGQLAQQGEGMAQPGGEPGMEELLQLAMQQRAIAQQLERMQAQGQLPGAGELAREAMELSRQIEAGRLTPETAERQQRLFRRMLDAGRSLEGDEPDERRDRRSEAARDAEARLPPGLEARLRRTAGDVPLPGWEELQQLPPAERRRVLEYFRRLAEGGG